MEGLSLAGMNTHRQQAAAPGGCSRLHGSSGGDGPQGLVSCLGHIRESDPDEGHEEMALSGSGAPRTTRGTQWSHLLEMSGGKSSALLGGNLSPTWVTTTPSSATDLGKSGWKGPQQ